MKEDTLDLLFQRLFDESLDEPARVELNAALRRSPEARARYRRALAVHAALLHHGSGSLPAFVRETPATRPNRFPWRKLAVAALIPLGLVLFALNDYRHALNSRPSAEILSSRDVTRPAGARGFPEGDLPARTPLEILSGTLEIGYPSGARVVLEGPCRFSLDEKEALTVLHGRASVHAPAGAEGFRIDTPGGHLIDRGTEFGVAVGSDGSQPVVLTEVFDGEIDVRTAGTADLRLARGQSRALIRDGGLLDTLDESPIHLVNTLHLPPASPLTPENNLALGKPVLSPGYCTRPHGSVFPPDNLTDGRLNDSGVPGDWSFWLAPDGESGEFTVDLLQPESISRISVQNTGNRSIDDRGTESFILLGSLDNRDFFPLTEADIPRIDPEMYGRNLPFHDFNFPAATARYVKFAVTSHYRHPERPADHPCQGGGLNEIRIFAK